MKADTTVPYGVVAHAMVVLQRAGADKVGLLTDPERPAPRSRESRDRSATGRIRCTAFSARKYRAGILFGAAARR